MNSEVCAELQRLLSELCDGQLTEAGHARLEALLDADEACRRLYLEYLDMHARLVVHPHLGGGSMPPGGAYPPGETHLLAESAAVPHRGRGAASQALRYALVAAGTLAASLLIQWLWTTSRPSDSGAPPSTATPAPAYVATLVQTSGCVWEGLDQPGGAGSRLAPSELHLRQGVARIRADGGSILLLEGPVVLRLESVASAAVLQGKVVFQADETAAPFDLHTPASTLVDFGTEYAVAVGPDGEEVHVFNGEVRRTPRAEENGPVEQLTAGQARHFAPFAKAAGKPVPLDEQRFIRHIAEPDEAAGDPAAGLLAYEGFDYKDADVLRNKKANGGFGWDGPWQGFVRPLRDDDANQCVLNLDEGLARPGPATPAIGGCFEYLGFSKYYRRLVTPVRMDADRLYYLSFLFRRQGPPADPLNAVAVLLRTNAEIRSEDSRKRLNVGVGGVNQLTHLNAVGSRTSLPLEYGTTYLLVAKIAARAVEPDQVFLRVYAPHETVESREPDSWTVVGPPLHSDLVFDWLEVHINSLTRQTLDEVRLGTTWASVAAPWMNR